MADLSSGVNKYPGLTHTRCTGSTLTGNDPLIAGWKKRRPLPVSRWRLGVSRLLSAGRFRQKKRQHRQQQVGRAGEWGGGQAQAPLLCTSVLPLVFFVCCPATDEKMISVWCQLLEKQWCHVTSLWLCRRKLGDQLEPGACGAGWSYIVLYFSFILFYCHLLSWPDFCCLL